MINLFQITTFPVVETSWSGFVKMAGEVVLLVVACICLLVY